MTRLPNSGAAGSLAALLKPEAIVLELVSRDKVAVIRELARPLIDDGTITDEQEFFSAVLRRENLESTGIGLGIAIPHARTGAVKKTALAFGLSREGVDFNSLDGKPSHVVFLIAAPEDRKTEYIMTLARVSKLLRRDEVRADLIAAQTTQDIVNIIARHE
jgi:fructose-specific phosphotransferase system IIA component